MIQRLISATFTYRFDMPSGVPKPQVYQPVICYKEHHMNSFVSSAVSNARAPRAAFTANGAVTLSTSGQSHLDLFNIIGSARNAQNDVVRLFSIAYGDDKHLALRTALWARDVRGGAGERQAFRNIVAHLINSDPNIVEKMIPHVAEFGRWDDMIETIPTSSYLFEIAGNALRKAIEGGNGLAAKWTPRKGDVAVALRNLWNMSPKQYRKFLVNNTKVVETLMCQQNWDAIEFDKLPSLAGLRYQAAFGKKATARYEAYKAKLVKGEVKINSSTLFPHNIVSNVRMHTGDQVVLDAQWATLPNYLGDKAGNVLVMSDVSGSMGCGIGGSVQAMDVSIALGLYTSERLRGPFKDLVLTFSESPMFHKVTGNGITERVRNLGSANWGMSTDIQAAFKLVLRTAIQNRVPQSDMPETIVIVSDMEFNACGHNTNYTGMRGQYEAAGYKLPNLVFWNVNGRMGNNPVSAHTSDACMVSGFSPALLETVLTGKDFDPLSIMLDVVMKERYDVVDVILS